MSLIAKYSIVVLILLASLNIANAQTDCPFEVDAKTVLSNKNLRELLEILKTDSFVIRTDKKQIPEIVYKQIKCIMPKEDENEFRLANPKEHARIGCVQSAGDKAPTRQLLFYAESKRMSVLTYISGTIGISTTVILIRYDYKSILTDADNRKIIDFWSGTIFDKPTNPKGIVENIEMLLTRQPWVINNKYDMAY